MKPIMENISQRAVAIVALIICVLPIFLAGCYTDTVDSFTKFMVQIPIHFTGEWRNKTAPDSSVDFTDLNDYQEYRDNKDKIQRTHFYQFAYWIDNISVGAGDPIADSVEFEFVRYYLFFPDSPNTKYLLGEFQNVKVKDYFRIPHVIEVPQDVARLLETAAVNKPRFFTSAEYSKVKSGGSGRFPSIDSRFDLVVRLELKL